MSGPDDLGYPLGGLLLLAAILGGLCLLGPLSGALLVRVRHRLRHEQAARVEKVAFRLLAAAFYGFIAYVIVAAIL